MSLELFPGRWKIYVPALRRPTRATNPALIGATDRWEPHCKTIDGTRVMWKWKGSRTKKFHENYHYSTLGILCPKKNKNHMTFKPLKMTTESHNLADRHVWWNSKFTNNSHSIFKVKYFSWYIVYQKYGYIALMEASHIMICSMKSKLTYRTW